MSDTDDCYFCKGEAPTDEQWNLLLSGTGIIDIVDLRHFARNHKKEWQRFIHIIEGTDQ